MDNSFYVTIGEAQAEITEKKSRFIANVREVHSEEEALAYINALRRKYWDARHNCYAFVTGKNNEIMRFSDDGEPQGTAGRPILDVLTGRNVRNTCIVVTRYFGGVLLGTGGLVRAYSKASSDGMDAIRVCEVYDGAEIEISCDYSYINKITRFLEDKDLPQTDCVYGEKVTFKAAVRDAELKSVCDAVTDLSSGEIVPAIGERMTFAANDGKAVRYTF